MAQQVPEMSKTEATTVIQRSFEGLRPEDEILNAALALCGITRPQYLRLKGEMRKVAVGRSSMCILTPTGGQRRR